LQRAAVALAIGRSAGDDHGHLRPTSGISIAFVACILAKVRSPPCREWAWHGWPRFPLTALVRAITRQFRQKPKEFNHCDDDNGLRRKGD